MRNHRRVVSVIVAFTLAVFATLAVIANASDKPAVFENKSLRVMFVSVNQTEAGDAIMLTLRFESVEKNDKFWLLFQGDADSVYLFDDKGGIWIPEYKGGLETCKPPTTNDNCPGDGSLFTPGQSVPVNLRFKPIKKSSGGKVLSFTAKMYLVPQYGYQTPLFIGLDSIRLP